MSTTNRSSATLWRLAAILAVLSVVYACGHVAARAPWRIAAIRILTNVEASQNASNAIPYLNESLTPMAVAPGSGGFTLTVRGTGFVPGSVVDWNGQSRATTFISASQLSAQITAADVATAGTASISVVSPAPGGGRSNSVLFEVTSAFSPVTMGQTELTAGANPVSIATGDFTGNGRLDLAVANNEPSGSITILLANGDGTFQSSTVYGGSAPVSILAADLNGDGKLDLAVANSGSGTISILLGNGDGTFQPPATYGVGTNPTSIVAADFNGDGKLDLAVANSGSGTISILLGNGDGTFQNHLDYPTGANPSALAVGDFNGDGNLDVAAANSDNTVAILLGAGDGSFPTYAEYAAGEGPSSLVVADFDGNGTLDLAVANTGSGTISVLLGNGDGTFAAHVDYAAGSNPAGIVTGDFDGDGKLDLAIANTGSNNVSMLLGKGDGTFQTATEFPTAAAPQSIVAADFNNDGRLDVAVASESAGSISMLLQTPVVGLSSTTLSFESQAEGSPSATQTVTVSNTGSAALSVGGVSVTGTNAGDFIESDNCSATSVSSGGSCAINVAFQPSTTSGEGASITISDSTGSQTISLSGTGTVSSTGNTNTSNSGSATDTAGQPVAGNQATFTGFDTATQGNWQGVYGADGYSIESDLQSLPVYGSFSVQNGINYIWDGNPSETRDLERASNSGRIAATWYNPQTYYFDVDLTDGNSHQFALYALDWDKQGRSETIQVSDGTTGAALDVRSISNFSQGVYVVWNLAGHVKIYVTATAGPNAVISGAFFGGGATISANVVVSPPSVSLAAGETQQFTAVVQNSASQVVNWSINPAMGTISATGLYTAPTTVTSVQVVTVTATSSSGIGTATIGLTPGATANFINSDSSTQGNWQGVYGSDGYALAGASQSIPGYASFAVQNQVNYTWASYTSDPRALETGDGASRIAAAWYNPQTFNFNVNLTDHASHQIALYALDWDGLGRTETIQILDANTNAVLDTRTISNFANGLYLVWNIDGDVVIQVTTTGSANAVISGVFFGGATTTSTGSDPQGSGSTPSGTVNFIAFDSATQGSWQGVYGTDGYDVVGDSQSIPGYAAFNVDNDLTYVWASNPVETRDLERASGPGRIAATLYNPQTFTFDVNFTDGNAHYFSLYALDWDNQGRAETIQVLDANTGAVLDSRSVANFSNGIYAVWNLSGHVVISVTATSGPNAVISGVFFGRVAAGSSGGSSAPVSPTVNFVATDAATQGNWQGVYGTDGYMVANDSQLIPPYAAIAVQNQLNYTWDGSTTDPRALENGADTGRIAATWYSNHDAIPPTFDFDVNFLDGNPHQFAMYALDWDDQGRAETIQIVDANSNAVLDTREISNFSNGIYLVWTITGHVKINVTETVGPNGVISGVFFGTATGLINVNVTPQSVNVPVGQTEQFAATLTGTTNQNVSWSISPAEGTISSTGLYTAPATLTSIQPITVTATSVQDGTRFGTDTINLTTATASFLAYDNAIEGNWQGVYGADGFSIAGDSQSLPSYAVFSVQNPNGIWVWDGDPTDPRALQTGSGAGRIAAAWYKNHDSFYLDVNMTDGQTHQFAMYAVDWDSTQRSETIQVLDATTNALLDSRTISNFNGGTYVIWNISGHVTININVASGANAVVSGVFFK